MTSYEQIQQQIEKLSEIELLEIIEFLNYKKS